MSFTDEQINALKAPLDRKHVKGRTQGNRQVSYIEGWWAIAEANRIFGFDAWNRYTTDLRQLGEPREVDGKWRVAYMAQVRVEVCAKGDGGPKIVIREGTGYGSGIDRDVGSAHESAIKEAETDAMKRALMTFGNPFGLALYDKTQANVATNGTSDQGRAGSPSQPVPPDAPSKARTNGAAEPGRKNAEAYAEGLVRIVSNFTDLSAVEDLWDERKAKIAEMEAKHPELHSEVLRAFGEARKRCDPARLMGAG